MIKMAKVTNFKMDGSELEYLDKSNHPHYMGQAFRAAASEAYPHQLAVWQFILRKSSKGFREAMRGWGTPDQRVQRECFIECAHKWRDLPDICPEIPQCPESTSKKNIWEHKEQYGVKSTYRDLFLGCCLSYCTDLEIEGPGGQRIRHGFIAENMDCFNCHSPCKDSTLSIAYTTNIMAEGEEQVLLAYDSQFHYDIPCCPGDEFYWSILAGGGTLFNEVGLGTIYRAPESNPGCSLNPTILLRDCCGREAILNIGINKPAAPQQLAYVSYNHPCDVKEDCHFDGLRYIYNYNIYYALQTYDCWGSPIKITGGDCISWEFCAQWFYERMGDECPDGPENPQTCGDIIERCKEHCPEGDKRTQQMIDAGCCPPV